MKVLIVDDSMTARSIVKRMLMPLGFETFEAGNGSDALNRLKEVNGCDVALVDWNMPVMNGLEFVKAVRGNRDYDGMKIVMITTEVEISHVTAALESGANEYIMKPFTQDILIGKLKLIGIIKD